jgi:hypothetical protein
MDLSNVFFPRSNLQGDVRSMLMLGERSLLDKKFKRLFG